MCRKLVLLAIIVSLLGSVDSASSINWTNDDPANDSWCTSGNWDPACPPGSTDTAVISTPYRGPIIDCDADVCARLMAAKHFNSKAG